MRNLKAMYLKKTIKSLIGYLYFSTGIYKNILKDRAIIIAFHRINDNILNDPLTLSSKKFISLCDFFKKFFKVINLEELITSLDNKKNISGSLVITFDDGYKDNFTLASKLLNIAGLNACFFISPGFIGTNLIPWWDKEKKINTEWMDWDDLKVMDSMGFEIGAHTINHVDLGIVKGKEARHEINECKNLIEKFLGIKVKYFSYPYGNKENIQDSNISIIKEVGYECCLSVCGGYVNNCDDKYNLKRIPVAGRISSAYEFGYEMLKWYK